MLRLFAAIPAPDDVAETLVRLQRGVPGARWSPRENFHITLRFFGEINVRMAEDLDAELAAIVADPFEVALKGAGHFGAEDPHALWMGVAANPALEALARKCELAAKRAGLASERRPYAPHLTMAYLGRTQLDRVMAFERQHALFACEPWRVTWFGLYSSWTGKRASQYQLEREYRLG
jgi:2'-5' RNA ligase